MPRHHHQHSSPLPSCFRPTTAAKHLSSATAAPAPVSGNPNLTTCLYHTDLGLFALTWSRNLFGRSLDLHLLLDNDDTHLALSAPSFHLSIKPFVFWNKQGSRKLDILSSKNEIESRDSSTSTASAAQIFWDLSRAQFGSGPEPRSGFYIAIVIDNEVVLLVGDLVKEARARTRADSKPETRRSQVMVLRREHVYGNNKYYATRANFGGKERDISIDCRVGGGGSDDSSSRLYFSVDNKRVLQIKHLRWKFRGSERIEIDGVNVHVSWDVYNWLFDQKNEQHNSRQQDDGYALFMFRFEKVMGFEDEDEYFNNLHDRNGMVLWSQQQSCGFEFETKKMKKGLLRSARSSSSSSLSSASSSCSSVMEWASMEENELKGPSGFSLLVYAWKR